jgi:hypothetical protein
VSRAQAPLVIDARPRGPCGGPLAVEPVLGRPLLSRLIEVGARLDAAAITVHARRDEQDALRSLAAGAPLPLSFATGPPPAGAFVLRADRLYDPRRLRRAWRRGGEPESAVLWRIDGPQALAAAGEELVRRQTFQPIGKYWALGPARWIARRLRETAIRPNHVTLAAAGLVLGAAGVVAFAGGSPSGGLIAAIALAVALVLDTADGHLARLQGTASAFGRWLDSNLDELGDLALHAAIAWSRSAQGTRPAWLLLGMAYAAGKYLFVFGATSWEEAGPPPPPAPPPPPPPPPPRRARRGLRAAPSPGGAAATLPREGGGYRSGGWRPLAPGVSGGGACGPAVAPVDRAGGARAAGGRAGPLHGVLPAPGGVGGGAEGAGRWLTPRSRP